MAQLDFDPEDYLDEIDSDDLVNELKHRNILPTHFKFEENKPDLTSWGKYPKRDMMLAHLELSPLASLDDIIEKVKENYYK